MKKESATDYAVGAFRYWAGFGCPTYEEAAAKVRSDAASKYGDRAEFVESAIADAAPGLYDILACEVTFRELEERGESIICDAVRDVYMVSPARRIRRGELSARVRAFACARYLSERQVYYYLSRARREFLVNRGLRLG